VATQPDLHNGNSGPGNSERVIRLPRRRRTLDASSVADYPPPLLKLRQQGVQVLDQFLQGWFEKVDDSLFDKSEKIGAQAGHDRYFAAMRELRLRRHIVASEFSREIEVAFQRLVEERRPARPQQRAGEHSLDELALVSDDELEELVAIDGMIAKAGSHNRQALQLLTKRLSAIFRHHDAVTDTSNPLGPSTLCYGFYYACDKLKLDIKSRLLIFKLFEQNVLDRLPQLYESANRLLISHGILGELGAGPAAESVKQPTPDSDAVRLGTGNTFSLLQSLMHSGEGGDIAAQRAGITPPGNAPILPQAQLMHLLQELQVRQRERVHTGAAGTEIVNVTQALGHLLSQQFPEQKLSMARDDHDVINLVGMLFDFILDDQRLHPLIRLLVAQLQIPLIKVAILDNGFFSTRGHPARKFLNLLARASQSWEPGSNPEQDPHYTRIRDLVLRILDQFDTSPDIFAEALLELRGLLGQDSPGPAERAAAAVPPLDGEAAYRQHIKQLLAEVLAVREVPEEIRRFSNNAWHRVLFAIARADGLESKRWRIAVRTLDELLWSTQDLANAEQHQRLRKLMPGLARNLRVGLQVINYDEARTQEFFDLLAERHRGILAVPPIPAERYDADEGDEYDDLTSGVSPGVTVHGAASHADGLPRVGEWVQIVQTSGAGCRCRLQQVDERSGRYVFVNKLGLLVEEFDRGSLLTALELGTVTRLDDGQLFDRALQSVITNLQAGNHRALAGA